MFFYRADNYTDYCNFYFLYNIIHFSVITDLMYLMYCLIALQFTFSKHMQQISWVREPVENAH